VHRGCGVEIERDDMNKNDIAWKVGIAVVFLMIGIIIVTETNIYQQQQLAEWQNITSWQENRTANALTNLIDTSLLQVGCVPWILTTGNRTFQMRLVPMNVSEVQP
jgi:preprotein translocase subunit SecY